MSRQSSSSTPKVFSRGSLPFEQDGLPGYAYPGRTAFPGREPWDYVVHHGPETSQTSLEGYLDPNSSVGGLFNDDPHTGGVLPFTHDVASLVPGRNDGAYIYNSFIDASLQYGSSKISPSDTVSGNIRHLEPWNHGIHAGAEISMANLSPVTTPFGFMPGPPDFGPFDRDMAGFGSKQMPWNRGPPVSPSQNSSATGSLSASVAMDFSRRNSMTYPSPSIINAPIEQAQLEAYPTPIATAAPAPGVQQAFLNEGNIKRKLSVNNGTKKMSRKKSTTTTAVESPIASEYPTPSPNLPIGMAPTADDEPCSISHEVSETRLPKPRPEPNLPQTGQSRPGSQRQRNRQAAIKCRDKTKAAMAQLEATERAMTLEHMELTRTVNELRGEVLALKNELLLHGNCDCEIIQQYLRNAARTIGGAGSVTSVANQGSTAAWIMSPQSDY